MRITGTTVYTVSGTGLARAVIIFPSYLQVLAQNRGRKSRDRPPEKPKKKSEGTVFTEEDFQKFEREYFGPAGSV